MLKNNIFSRFTSCSCFSVVAIILTNQGARRTDDVGKLSFNELLTSNWLIQISDTNTVPRPVTDGGKDVSKQGKTKGDYYCL